MTFPRTTMLAVAMALAAGLSAPVALAQKAPAKPATAKPEKPAKKSKSKRKASACAGLAQGQCTANKECGWIKPKKKVSSNGRKLTAYCRKVAGIARKKKAQ